MDIEKEVERLDKLAEKQWNDIYWAANSSIDLKKELAAFAKAVREKAFREAIKECQSQEYVHHKYADTYEEGLRDMADLLAQAIFKRATADEEKP